MHWNLSILRDGYDGFEVKFSGVYFVMWKTGLWHVSPWTFPLPTDRVWYFTCPYHRRPEVAVVVRSHPRWQGPKLARWNTQTNGCWKEKKQCCEYILRHFKTINTHRTPPRCKLQAAFPSGRLVFWCQPWDSQGQEQGYRLLPHVEDSQQIQQH